jgi:hypothetical protein
MVTTCERRLWTAAGAWLLLIYSTLYVARPITEALRERNLLRLAVGVAFGLAALGVVVWGRRRPLGWRGWVVVATAGAATLVAASFLRLPEERLHFVEYGLLAALVHGALSQRQARHVGLWTVMLTAAAGLGDELIQGILPNRYFGWRDVALNAGAGTLVAISLALLDRCPRSEG